MTDLSNEAIGLTLKKTKQRSVIFQKISADGQEEIGASEIGRRKKLCGSEKLEKI